MTQEQINEILYKHELWLKKEKGGECANLNGAGLLKADLREARLNGADLRYADLRGADLRGADLLDADLNNADLRGADLKGAKMYQHMIDEASLTQKQREGIIIVEKD